MKTQKIKRIATWPVWYIARLIRAPFPFAEQRQFHKWHAFPQDCLLISWIASSVFVSLHFIYIGFIIVFVRWMMKVTEEATQGFE